MDSIYDYIAFGSAIILVILILIQTRGASLGAGMGGSGEVSAARRGSDMTLHQITISFVVIFAVSLMAGFIV